MTEACPKSRNTVMSLFQHWFVTVKSLEKCKVWCKVSKWQKHSKRNEKKKQHRPNDKSRGSNKIY